VPEPRTNIVVYGANTGMNGLCCVLSCVLFVI
jgi:hypothetical protein